MRIKNESHFSLILFAKKLLMLLQFNITYSKIKVPQGTGPNGTSKRDG